MLWGEQRWPEVADGDKERVVVWPIASLEQHGHHLPLLTDTMLVSAVAERCRTALPDDRYLWLPTLWLGCSEHHRAMAGTLSLPAAVYVEVLERVLENLVTDGYSRIVLLNGHGGNIVPGNLAVYNVCDRHDRADLWVVLASYWVCAREAIGRLDCMETPGLTHACEYETSMMLSLRPDLVDLSTAHGGVGAWHSPWWDATAGGTSRVAASRGFHQITTTGAMGDPSLATADKGARLLEAVVGDVTAFLREFAGWGPMG